MKEVLLSVPLRFEPVAKEGVFKGVMSSISTVIQDVATANSAEWLDPEVNVPPRGCDVLILSKGGVLIRGHWRNDQGHLAWSPLPKKPKWLQDKLRAAYFSAVYPYERTPSGV